MDATFWTLASGSATKSFATWGISAAMRTLRNQAIDTFTFTIKCKDISDDPPFAAKDKCRVYRDAKSWFSGLVTKISRRATATEQAFDYELSGGWYWLETLTFQQLWNFADDPTNKDSPLHSEPTSRINFFQRIDGERLSTREQITEAVDYVVAHGAPIALGALDLPNVYPPFSQLSAQSCSEIVRAALRWHPDAVARFDYSVYPPLLKITKRATCTAVNRPFSDAPSAGVAITPRHDLLVAGVQLIYEAVNSIDETSWSVKTVDEAGDVDTFNSVVTPVELGGASETWQRQKLSVTAWFPALPSFWIAKFPALALAKVPDGTGLAGIFTVENAKVNGVAIDEISAINEITDGALPEWLDLTTSEATVTADLSYSLKNPTTGAEEVKIAHPVSQKIKMTSLFAGANQIFSQLTGTTEAEPIPVGVAQAYYAAASVLHYEGQWTIVEREVSSQCGLGNVLNLTGGPEEWEAMNALIEQVTENLESGTTVLTFGPPEHLSPQDFIALLRVQRERKANWRLRERIEGKAYRSSAKVDGPTQMPQSKPDQPAVPGKTIVLADKPLTNPSKIIFRADDIVAPVRALADKDVKLREIRVCNDADPDGDNWYMQVPCSAPYQK
jgi:hypothetical protein